MGSKIALTAAFAFGYLVVAIPASLLASWLIFECLCGLGIMETYTTVQMYYGALLWFFLTPLVFGKKS